MANKAKNLKTLTNIQNWIDNATEVLKLDFATRKYIDSLLSKNGKLSVEKLFGFLTKPQNSQGSLISTDTIQSANFITKYIHGETVEGISGLKNASDPTVKDVYTLLHELKKMYRAKATLKEAGKDLKPYKPIISQALRMKWSIKKPKNNKPYTDEDIISYANQLGTNFNDLNSLFNFANSLNQQKIEDITKNLKETKNKDDAIKNINSLNDWIKKAKKQTKNISDNLKKSNPFAYIFLNKGDKFPSKKIESSVERITASNDNPSETIATNQSTEENSTPKKTNETDPMRPTQTKSKLTLTKPSKKATMRPTQTKSKSDLERPAKMAPKPRPTRKTSPKSNKK